MLTQTGHIKKEGEVHSICYWEYLNQTLAIMLLGEATGITK